MTWSYKGALCRLLVSIVGTNSVFGSCGAASEAGNYALSNSGCTSCCSLSFLTFEYERHSELLCCWRAAPC